MKVNRRDARGKETDHSQDTSEKGGEKLKKEKIDSIYIEMKFIVILTIAIFLYCSCNQNYSNYQINKRQFGDTIVIDSILNKKIISRTAYLNENIYIHINFEKQFRLLYKNGKVITKNDTEKNFEFRYYTNGKIKSILKKDSFDKVYYYNEYDSVYNNIIDIYRDIICEDTLLNKDTLLCIPKIHTKFDNIDNYRFTIHYDSSYKIDNKNSTIIKTKDGYKLYCKSKCNFITKVCDTLGCYSMPLELKLH